MTTIDTKKLLLVLSLTALTSCMRGATTKQIPPTTISGSSDTATLVFLRPWLSTLNGIESVENTPYGYHQDYVRIISDRETPLADLRFNQYSVVEMSPGKHNIFAYNWADNWRVPDACIGALSTSLEAGRVYPVMVRDGRSLSYPGRKGPTSRPACKELTLMKGDDLETFWSTVWRSERRELKADRERSTFVDGKWIVKSVMESGQRRVDRNQFTRIAATDFVKREATMSVPTKLGASLGDRPRPIVTPLVDAWGGMPYTDNNALIATDDSALGFNVGVSVGVTFFDRLQVLLSGELGSPGVGDQAAQAFAIPGNYASTMVSGGLQARLVSPVILGVEWLGGFGVRGKWMDLAYFNPDSTAPPLMKRRGKRKPDASLNFSGLGYGPIFGGRRTIFGQPGKSQLAFVMTLQPEWTSWRPRGAKVFRDDTNAMEVGETFENLELASGSWSWNLNAGVELGF